MVADLPITALDGIAASHEPFAMLIRRCAWHREFYGYTIIHGVAAWRGFSVKFSDGVCKSCAARVRIEWRIDGRDAKTRPTVSIPGGPGWIVLTTGILLTVATLAIRPISDEWLGTVPGEYALTLNAREAAVGLRDMRLSGEADPPRVWRQGTGAKRPAKARPSRRHASARTVPAALPVAPPAVISPLPDAAFLSLAEPAPNEEELIKTEPVQIASVAPSLSRSLTEDEFSRQVRRASLMRVLLMGGLDSPPSPPRSARPGGPGALLDLASIQGP